MSRLFAEARLGILPILATSLSLSFAALAQTSQPIAVTHAWARATPPSATTGAVYLTIANTGPIDDALTGLSTPVAQQAELHATSNENGVMKMAPVADEPIKAGGSVEIKPGGLHIMLTGLAHPLKPGETFPLTLTFRQAGKVETTVTVWPMGATGLHKDSPDQMPGMKM